MTIIHGNNCHSKNKRNHSLKNDHHRHRQHRHTHTHTHTHGHRHRHTHGHHTHGHHNCGYSIRGNRGYAYYVNSSFLRGPIRIGQGGPLPINVVRYLANIGSHMSASLIPSGPNFNMNVNPKMLMSMVQNILKKVSPGQIAQLLSSAGLNVSNNDVNQLLSALGLGGTINQGNRSKQILQALQTLGIDGNKLIQLYGSILQVN